MHRYGRQDIIYVMLDKRIDDIREEVKELKGDVKDLRTEMRGEFASVRSEMKELNSKVVSTQADIKVLDSKIEGILDSIKQGKTLNKWIFGMLVTLLLGLAGLAVPFIISLAN